MDRQHSQTRRRFLAATGVAGATGLAGCMGLFGGGDETDKPTLTDFRGSGALVSDRPAPGGTSIKDLPDLEGELSIYLGGGEGGRYTALIDLINDYYDGFEATSQTQPSSQLANIIVDEHDSGTTQADLFWSVDAGSLAYVADQGASQSLSSDARSMVADDRFVTDNWAGLAGRSRAIPYNTDVFSESDIPSSIDTFASASRFQGNVGWAPTYGAFHGFVTAMRKIRGDEATREWLNSMLDQNPARYSSEYATVSQGVTNGEVGVGITNHYYPMIVLSNQPEASLDLAFTENDAGSLVNTAGASVLEGASNTDTANLFVRHLLSAEAQEFLATRGYAFPMIEGVEPVGPLPTINELSPPDLDLQELSDVQPTIELLEDVGILS
jgi:iron(III) transport system substrate-binding protein